MVIQRISPVAFTNVCLSKSVLLVLVLCIISSTDFKPVNASETCSQRCGRPMEASMPETFGEISIASAACPVFECYYACYRPGLQAHPLYDSMKDFCSELKGKENSVQCPAIIRDPAFSTCLDTCQLSGHLRDKTLDNTREIINDQSQQNAKAICKFELCREKCLVEGQRKHCGTKTARIWTAFYALRFSHYKRMLEGRNRWPDECQKMLDYYDLPSAATRSSTFVNFSFLLVGIVVVKQFFYTVFS